MTTSRHTHQVWLERPGQPDTPLRCKGGTLTLDAQSAPHISGTLRIAPGGGSLSQIIDPRGTNRVRVETIARYENRTDERVFNLALRERTEDVEDEITIEIASDEALLIDYAPLTDDTTPRTLEGSLRDVIDYVLGTVIPGAQLEAEPAHDADVTRYWESVNLMTNPSVANTDTGYTAGTNTAVAERSTNYGYVGDSSIRWHSSAAGDAVLHCRSFPVEQGNSYVARAWITAVAGRSVRILARFRDPDGNVIRDVYGDATVSTGTPNFEPVDLIVPAPEGAVSLSFNLVLAATAGGKSCYADAFMLYEGDELADYWSGSTAPTGYVTYWDDGAHQSTSTRVPIIERDRDSLTWKAGQTALDFLHPLVQAAGFRLVCDESRQWTLRDEDYTAPGNLSFRYGVNITDKSESISRDSDLWFDAAVTRYRWTRNGREYERIDAYALNTPHTRLRTFEKNTPYPGPGFSEYAVRRAQGRGREVSASAVADWRTRAEQTAEVFLENAPTQIGRTETVTFDLDRDEVSATLRTTEYADSAWILIPEDEAWTDSPIGESWTEEVI